jgi:hypothetical protein
MKKRKKSDLSGCEINNFQRNEKVTKNGKSDLKMKNVTCNSGSEH